MGQKLPWQQGQHASIHGRMPQVNFFLPTNRFIVPLILTDTDLWEDLTVCPSIHPQHSSSLLSLLYNLTVWSATTSRAKSKPQTWLWPSQADCHKSFESIPFIPLHPDFIQNTHIHVVSRLGLDSAHKEKKNKKKHWRKQKSRKKQNTQLRASVQSHCAQ